MCVWDRTTSATPAGHPPGVPSAVGDITSVSAQVLVMEEAHPTLVHQTPT